MSASAHTSPATPTILLWGRRYPFVPPRLGDPRLHLAIVIWSLQVIGLVALDFDRSIPQVVIPTLTCAVLEVGITFWRQRVVMWPASALLTGNGIAFILLIPGTEHGAWWSFDGWWILVATSVVALLSKYVIRFRGRHLFNPSNFGLVLCFIVLGETLTEPLFFWWGPMSIGLALGIGVIATGGLGILSRLRQLRVAVAFWLTFAASLAVLAASGHAMTASWHLGPITDWSFWWVLVTSPEVLVFMCFMITDPRTAPFGRVARSAYAFSVGLLATLLMASRTSEFDHKVAVLLSLAIVCAFRPLLERVLPEPGSPDDSLPALAARLIRGTRAGRSAGRLVTVGAVCLAGVAGVGAILVAAGSPSGSTIDTPLTAAAAPSAPLADSQLPEITIVPSRQIAQIDRETAAQMARDVVAGFRIQSQALMGLDLERAKAGAAGSLLAELEEQIRAGIAGASIDVPTRRLEQMSIALAPSSGQAGPVILATFEGTIEVATYRGSSGALTATSETEPFHETYELALLDGHYMIVASRGQAAPAAPPPKSGQIAVELRTRAAQPVPQGSPIAIEVLVRNTGSLSASTDLRLALTGPEGKPVPFYEDVVLVPADGVARTEAFVTPAQWFETLGSYEIAASAGGTPLGDPLVVRVSEATVPVPRFEDVTAAAGLETTVPAPDCGRFSSGAAWADVDDDADLDLFLTRLGEPAQLFISDGRGRFTDEAPVRGEAVRSANGAAFADYDNDGDPDLYVARDGPDLLLRNDGSGRFEDVSAAAGIDDDYRGMSVSWADYDGDGDLDLYVTNYMRCTGDWNAESLLLVPVEYHPDKLYRNDGDGTFTDVTALLEKDPATTHDGATTGAGFAAAWFDYNGDNRLDLYLANDFIGPEPDQNRLWRNDGPGADGWKLTDVSSESATGFFMNTMGIGAGDFDRDGDLDLALSNIGANKLLRNNGDGAFTDDAEAMGVARPFQQAGVVAVTWAAGFYDFNLDGSEDLYLAAGNIMRHDAPLGEQPNELYVNDGVANRFLDLSAPSGADDPGDSKGVAFADYDGDGDVDLFVVNQGGSPTLYRNVTPREGRHWLEIDTIGAVSNRDGCGARVQLTLGNGSTMIRQVSCGSTSVSSGSQKEVHFGLGESPEIAKLEVIWPSGIRQALHDIDPDQAITVVEQRT